jgi:DNA polymerase-1
MSTKRTRARKNVLIVDGDPYAYQAAIRHEVAVQWEDGVATAHVDTVQAVADAADRIRKLADKLKADAVLCLSCPTGRYFRNELGSYKAARKVMVRPLNLRGIKQGLAEEFETYIFPKLEGDDVIGILMTDPTFKPKQQKISVSIDKDLRTIPGLFVNPDKFEEPILIDQRAADLWFHAQAIAGDLTDGYSGAPGFGVQTAFKLLENGLKVETYLHTLERGPRKGDTEERKREIPASSLWETVVSCYEAVGLNEDVALFNARLARILTADLWDSTTKTPILWTP